MLNVVCIFFPNFYIFFSDFALSKDPYTFVNQELLDHLGSPPLNNSISPDYRKENSRPAHLKSFRYLRHSYLFTNGRYFFDLQISTEDINILLKKAINIQRKEMC